MKSADGKILDDNLLSKISNDTIIIQNKNSSEKVQVQQNTLPIAE